MAMAPCRQSPQPEADRSDECACLLLANDLVPEGNSMVTKLRVPNVENEPKVKPA